MNTKASIDSSTDRLQLNVVDGLDAVLFVCDQLNPFL